FLTAGPSHEQALAVLDDFLESQAKRPIKDPLRRAVLQHDLWGVFVTTAGLAGQEVIFTREGRTLKTQQFIDYGDNDLDRLPQRRQLQRRLAAALRLLALTGAEIDALPDNFSRAVKTGAFPTEFDPDHSGQAFLPPDLLAADGPWVAVTNSTRP